MRIREAILGLKIYQAGKPINEVKRELGLDDIVKMASNENPFGCSPKVKEMMTELAQELHLYPDASNFELKKALAEHLGVSTGMIFTGAGSDLLIRAICSMFLDPGDESIMGEVTFQRYEDSTQIMGAKSIKIPMLNHGLDIDAMISAITDKTRIIWFCSPNNPTGPIIKEKELMSALDRIPEDVMIIMDEAYYEYVTDPEYPQTIPLLDKYKNMIILRTFSKAYGLAGLRLGYGMASEEITRYLNAIIGPFDVNLVAQTAAVAALKDGDFLNMVVAENTAGRDYLSREFERLGLEYIPSQSNFIMVNVEMDDMEGFRELLKRGLIIRPGHLLGMDGWMRVSIGNMDQNKRFIKELEYILK